MLRWLQPPLVMAVTVPPARSGETPRGNSRANA